MKTLLNFLNLNFLKKIAEFSPAIARFIEGEIYVILIFGIDVLFCLLGGECLVEISWQALLAAMSAPVLMAFSKWKRDLEKLNG